MGKLKFCVPKVIQLKSVELGFVLTPGLLSEV